MNGYFLHLGDYFSRTHDLNYKQHGIYLLLLADAYTSEAPLPNDMRILRQKCHMDPRVSAADVVLVLGRFFELTEAGFVHKRVERELIRRHSGGGTDDRKERHNEERKRLFSTLRGAGFEPSWKASIYELRALVAKANLGQPRTDSDTSSGTTLAYTYTCTNTQERTARVLGPSLDVPVDSEPPLARAFFKSEKKEKEYEHASEVEEIVSELRRCGFACNHMVNKRVFALLQAGVQFAEFEDAAREAVQRKRPVQWMFARIEGRFRDFGTAPPTPQEAGKFGRGDPIGDRVRELLESARKNAPKAENSDPPETPEG
jgi:uncharacterized protein YdaU (DUF1376 family)